MNYDDITFIRFCFGVNYHICSMYLATSSYSTFFIVYWWKKKAFGDNTGHYHKLLMFYSCYFLFGKDYRY